MVESFTNQILFDKNKNNEIKENSTEKEIYINKNEEFQQNVNKYEKEIIMLKKDN